LREVTFAGFDRKVLPGVDSRIVAHFRKHLVS